MEFREQGVCPYAAICCKIMMERVRARAVVSGLKSSGVVRTFLSFINLSPSSADPVEGESTWFLPQCFPTAEQALGCAWGKKENRKVHAAHAD